MIKKILLFIIIPAQLFAQNFSKEEISRWDKEAKNVNIIRDDYGVPHIYGKSDANAVFGLMYAQCEENFQQVELNNLEMLGRLSEVYGKQQLYEDLQMRLIYDPAKAIHDYKQSPLWLKKLCDAAADGVNYYLYKHPETKPLVLKHFETLF
jgi:acyl-homoserine lactone acylase PvdQ